MTTTVFTDTVTLTAASWFNDADDSIYSGLTGPAGTNTITATGPANFAYTSLKIVRWIPAGTNTGATTLNITPSGSSALGAKNVFFNGVACVGGEIKSGVPVQAVYDGTQFQLLHQGYSSTYTPTLSAGVNVAASTMRVTGYMRVMDFVFVAGNLDIDVTTGAPTATSFEITLPVASNIANIFDVGGTMTSTTANSAGSIFGSVGNNTAVFSYSAAVTANETIAFHFGYRVI